MKRGLVMALTLVLSIGLDPELLSTRNFVLQSAGYFVVPAYSLKEAVDRFVGGDFDLVLLCQSIPIRDKDRLISWIRASGSRIPVVCDSGKFNEDERVDGITVDGDLDGLLVTINDLLINAAPAAVSTPISCHKKDANVLAEQGKKSPQSVTGNERQARTTKEPFVHLAHAG
jgi:CheY-like chemotaxis protein